MPGTLFIVATPIGNLEDLSLRALRVLKEVDLVAAEDTRRTAKLFSHYGIHRPMVSLHEHNEWRETPVLVQKLLAGQSIALVSDAGTPGISDPGQHFVKAAREAGIPVSPIPGPSAIMAALSVSGEPASQFVFMGFPPRSGRQRENWLKDLSNEPRTVVAFEAPHRIARLISDMVNLLAERPIQIHREITKSHEDLVIYTKKSEKINQIERGEFVVVVGSASHSEPKIVDEPDAPDTASRMFDCLTKFDSFSEDQAERLVSSATGLDQKQVRKAVKKARIAVKQRQTSDS